MAPKRGREQRTCPCYIRACAAFPSSYTADIFDEGQLLYKDDTGGFDLSPQTDDVHIMEDAVKAKMAEVEKAYKEELSGKTRKERGDIVEEEKREKQT